MRRNNNRGWAEGRQLHHKIHILTSFVFVVYKKFVRVSKLYRGEVHKPQKSYLNSQLMLPSLVLGPRRKAASLMEKDRIRQCPDVTGLKKIQIDRICLWRQLENRVGGPFVTSLSLFQMWLFKFELNVFGDFLQREPLGRLPFLVISHVLLLRGETPIGTSELRQRQKCREGLMHNSILVP